MDPPPKELERAKACLQRLQVKEEPEAYLHALAMFARAATTATEGQLMCNLSDEKLNQAQRRKKMDTCLNQAAAWAEFTKAPVKKNVHPAVLAHAMASVIRP